MIILYTPADISYRHVLKNSIKSSFIFLFYMIKKQAVRQCEDVQDSNKFSICKALHYLRGFL